MAAQISHVLAGEAALRSALPEEAETVLDAAGPAFRLGCQGPDIFYHNQRSKPSGLHYGALAHRRNYGRLMAGAVASLPPARLAPSTGAAAYLLGLATHAALDRATHPFIVCFAGWSDPGLPGSERFRSCHPFLERLLDAGLLAAERGLAPSGYDLGGLLAPEPKDAEEAVEAAALDEELVAVWAAALRTAFPRSAGGDFLLERRVANALADGRYFFAVTNPAVTALNEEREDWFAYLDDREGARSVALVYPDSLPPGLDVMNLSREEWPHPSGDGRVSRASYLDLVAEGSSAAAMAILALRARMDGALGDAGLEEAIGNGGLSVCDPAGAPAPPRVSRPLPLAGVMETEYRRRLDWARERLSRRPGARAATGDH